jgi:hypothetical protein
MAHNWLIGIALLLGLVFVLSRDRDSARSPAWMLLRCLFPSWRFYEDIAPGPELGYRISLDGKEYGPWQTALIPPPRSFGALVVNARGNLNLCYRSLVERFCDDIDEAQGAAPGELEQMVSYRLVQRLVETLVHENVVIDTAPPADGVGQRDAMDSGGAVGDGEGDGVCSVGMGASAGTVSVGRSGGRMGIGRGAYEVIYQFRVTFGEEDARGITEFASSAHAL